MARSNDQFQELLDRSQQFYIADLESNIHKMIGLLNTPVDNLSSDMIREILRLFHSLKGTASTLGLAHLAELGKEGEFRVQAFLVSGQESTYQLTEEIIGALNKIRHLLSNTQPSAGGTSKEVSETDIVNYTNLPDTCKILLIDDDTSILNILENAFTREGYTVYICDDSPTAMDIIALCKPDLILLDIMMPKVDGYEILAKITEKAEYSDICVIFLSAMDDIEAKIKGMEAGIDDYITKPFNLREVVLRVEMILRRANKYKEKLLLDTLTGAYSRYYLNERFKDELDRYKRNKTLFSVAFIDLDFFKHINDDYGHQTGDFVLKQFSEFMRLNIRESDCLFRYGGEEFIVLLPDNTEQQTYHALERIREAFTKQPLYFAGNPFFITFSCGIKEVDDKDKSVSQLLGLVDRAMYAAKKAGRNRVVKYSSLSNEAKIKKTLLIVDDESTILKLLSERLSVCYNVVLASDGQQALDLLSERLVDAIVLDLILPDMDGLEICRIIKENPLTNNTRIVILSQRSSESDIVEGLHCGADDFVTKPFSMAELEARIMRVLKY